VTNRDTRVPHGLHGYALSQVSERFDQLTSTFRNASCALTRQRTGVRVPQRPLRTGWPAVFFLRFEVDVDREVRLRSVRDRDVVLHPRGGVSSASLGAEVAGRARNIYPNVPVRRACSRARIGEPATSPWPITRSPAISLELPSVWTAPYGRRPWWGSTYRRFGAWPEEVLSGHVLCARFWCWIGWAAARGVARVRAKERWRPRVRVVGGCGGDGTAHGSLGRRVVPTRLRVPVGSRRRLGQE
jgi:hypothetical protein